MFHVLIGAGKESLNPQPNGWSQEPILPPNIKQHILSFSSLRKKMMNTLTNCKSKRRLLEMLTGLSLQTSSNNATEPLPNIYEGKKKKKGTRNNRKQGLTVLFMMKTKWKPERGHFYMVSKIIGSENEPFWISGKNYRITHHVHHNQPHYDQHPTRDMQLRTFKRLFWKVITEYLSWPLPNTRCKVDLQNLSKPMHRLA